MARKRRLYIAYGSNLNLPQMALRCRTAKAVGTSELKDYELLFRGSRHGAVATVEPKEGSSVPVLVWDIQKLDEEALDIYEGYPRFYEKEMMDIELNGKTVSAMVYVMTPGHLMGIPSDRYADTIRQGYETAGFDTGILEDAIRHSDELAMQEDKKLSYGQPSLFGMGGWSGIN